MVASKVSYEDHIVAASSFATVFVSCGSGLVSYYVCICPAFFFLFFRHLDQRSAESCLFQLVLLFNFVVMPFDLNVVTEVSPSVIVLIAFRSFCRESGPECTGLFFFLLLCC